MSDNFHQFSGQKYLDSRCCSLILWVVLKSQQSKWLNNTFLQIAVFFLFFFFDWKGHFYVCILYLTVLFQKIMEIHSFFMIWLICVSLWKTMFELTFFFCPHPNKFSDPKPETSSCKTKNISPTAKRQRYSSNNTFWCKTLQNPKILYMSIFQISSNSKKIQLKTVIF